MSGFLPRSISRRFTEALAYFPVVALVGPRQCGKSTFARHHLARHNGHIYLDLENPSDLAKLDDPMSFLRHYAGRLVCIDEVQRYPELFAMLRSTVDETGEAGQFVVLGSASPELLRQSAESLAGRIAYLEMMPFTRKETASLEGGIERLWLRGGFPRSHLAPEDSTSAWWLREFISTYLERDVVHWGFRIPAQQLRRLWRMLAHEHGQILNCSKLAQALGVSSPTVRSWVDILCATYQLRLLPALLPNLRKRLVKRPRVYLRDSGILHSLLGLDSFDELLGHPLYGASWEGLVIEQAIHCLPNWQPHFFRTNNGAELDLVLTRGNKRIAIEIKASAAPTLTKGFWSALEDVKPDAAFVVARVDEGWPLRDGVTLCSLDELLEALAEYR